MASEITRLKGKIGEWLGMTTGDREVEAHGKLEKGGQKPSKAQVRNETTKVKESHHDYGERVPPQEVPHADR
jgi:uncharacterized protein YjbJ (UPF0337 family)